MPYVYTITPHQKINSWGISSQWEGKHTRFDEGTTIESLEIRKKIGKDHNDMPDGAWAGNYEHVVVEGAGGRPGMCSLLARYEVWCRGFEDGKLN